MREHILSCKSLIKKYDGVVALDNVTYTFPKSGIVGIIGPNGAGKTTLFHVLSGFTRPNSGRFYVNQLNSTGLKPYQIAASGLARTFQNIRLVRQLTVLDNVLLARRRQRGERLVAALTGLGIAGQERQNKAIALHHLDMVGLSAKVLNYATNLSYGEQKLLTLACCLASDARVLLLDEPVAGVHPKMVSQILKILRSIREGGSLMVFIEHDINAVREIADEVLVMDHGKIIASGIPSDTLNEPEIVNAYVT
jgi:ABC-type branched-subunit amino acid transport system ATPase component